MLTVTYEGNIFEEDFYVVDINNQLLSGRTGSDNEGEYPEEE